MTSLPLPLPQGKYNDAKNDLLHALWDQLSIINGANPAALLTRSVKGGFSNATEDLLFQIVSELGLIAGPLKNRLNECVNVLDFGADPTGVADSTDAFEAAIAKIGKTSTRNGLYVPTGTYLITRTLDLTNTRSGSNFRDSLCVFGDGIFCSQILGKTGAGHAIIDATGNQWLKLHDLQLSTNGTAGSSTIGLYKGVFQSLQQTQNQVHTRLGIFMHHDPTANGGNGTIPIYNFGAEENTYDTVFLIGNRCMVATGIGDGPLTYGFPVHPLVSSHSLGLTTFNGECFMQALGGIQPALELINVNSVGSDNLYISASIIEDVPQTQFQAIRIRGGAQNCHLRGTIEGFSGIAQIYGRAIISTFDFQLGGVNSTGHHVMQLEHGAEGIIEQCLIRVNMSQDTTRPFWNVTTTLPNQVASCYVKDTDVYSNSVLEDMMLPEKLAFNPKTTNTRLLNAGQVYTYDSNQQHTIIPRTMIRGFAGANPTTRIATIKLPTVIMGTSALSVAVRIEGMAGHNVYVSGAITTLFWQGTLTLAVDQNGTVTLGTPVVTNSGAMALIPVANTLSGVNLTGVVVGNTVQINVTPDVSGADNDAVYFTGKIKMYWGGNSCNAPSMAF